MSNQETIVVKPYKRRADAPHLAPHKDRGGPHPRYKGIKISYDFWVELVEFHNKTDNRTLEDTLDMLLKEAKERRQTFMESLVEEQERYGVVTWDSVLANLEKLDPKILKKAILQYTQKQILEADEVKKEEEHVQA